MHSSTLKYNKEVALGIFEKERCPLKTDKTKEKKTVTKSVLEKLVEKGLFSFKKNNVNRTKWEFKYQDLLILKLFCTLRKMEFSTREATKILCEIPDLHKELGTVGDICSIARIAIIKIGKGKAAIALQGHKGIFFSNDLKQLVFDFAVGDLNAVVHSLGRSTPEGNLRISEKERCGND